MSCMKYCISRFTSVLIFGRYDKKIGLKRKEQYFNAGNDIKIICAFSDEYNHMFNSSIPKFPYKTDQKIVEYHLDINDTMRSKCKFFDHYNE